MEEREDYTRASEGGPSGPAGPGGPTGPGGARPRRHVEDRLDDLADRFSKAMNEGARRVEDAFDKGMHVVNEDPEVARGKIKNFFQSSTGGVVLVIVGFVWFFYTVGLFDKPIFPILVIVLGFYLMYRYKRQ